jgi:hypothetical protein
MGLGRMQLEHEQIAAETATRRQLDVEAQMNEDAETTQSRLQRAEERERVEAHVQEIKRSFFCEVCNTSLPGEDVFTTQNLLPPAPLCHKLAYAWPRRSWPLLLVGVFR